jgi:hypothetical protein
MTYCQLGSVHKQGRKLRNASNVPEGTLWKTQNDTRLAEPFPDDFSTMLTTW